MGSKLRDYAWRIRPATFNAQEAGIKLWEAEFFGRPAAPPAQPYGRLYQRIGGVLTPGILKVRQGGVFIAGTLRQRIDGAWVPPRSSGSVSKVAAVTGAPVVTENHVVDGQIGTLYQWTSSGTITFAVATSARYLVVAGGGSGGRANYGGSGGGGGGGLLQGTMAAAAETYTVTVGTGAPAVQAPTLGNGSQGGNSSITGPGAPAVAIGGGGGSATDNALGGAGGSGGGSGWPLADGGPGTAGQGHNGGPGTNGPGGGGGAGAAATGFGGGVGIVSPLTDLDYAAGGGASAAFWDYPNTQPGSGGGPSGGNGGIPAANGGDGVRGGGGGGRGPEDVNNASRSGAGGNGVVCLFIPTT